MNSPENGALFILHGSFPACASHEIVSYLSLHGIYLSAGSTCTKEATSPVLKACTVVEGALRIGLSKYSTLEEGDTLVWRH